VCFIHIKIARGHPYAALGSTEGLGLTIPNRYLTLLCILRTSFCKFSILRGDPQPPFLVSFSSSRSGFSFGHALFCPVQLIAEQASLTALRLFRREASFLVHLRECLVKRQVLRVCLMRFNISDLFLQIFLKAAYFLNDRPL